MNGDPITHDINTPVHVTPVNDQIEHVLDEDCPCGPASEAVKRDDGSVGWVIAHHSLDGRERDEGGPLMTADETPDVERCGRKVGSRPWWMSEGQYDPCHCIRRAGHGGECACDHTIGEADD